MHYVTLSLIPMDIRWKNRRSSFLNDPRQPRRRIQWCQLWDHGVWPGLNRVQTTGPEGPQLLQTVEFSVAITAAIPWLITKSSPLGGLVDGLWLKHKSTLGAYVSPTEWSAFSVTVLIVLPLVQGDLIVSLRIFSRDDQKAVGQRKLIIVFRSSQHDYHNRISFSLRRWRQPLLQLNPWSFALFSLPCLDSWDQCLGFDLFVLRFNNLFLLTCVEDTTLILG